jgi:serine/threonine protein kinase
MTNTLKNYLSTSSINDRPKEVFLVQRKDKIYAMKTIRKDLLLEKTLITHCLLEKEVLMKTKHPFVVNMEHVFQTENRIFFIM